MTLIRACTAMLALCLLATATIAQEWHPVVPEQNGKDWVRLTSGEWVSGTIDLVRDLKMEFDSDELDDLVLDWEDIAGFRSPRILTHVFTRVRVVTGTASMDADVIKITSTNGVSSEFPRHELLSILEGEPREINYWSSKASVGATARTGNTDRQDMQAILRIKREGSRSRLNLEYQGNFGEVSNEQTINNHRVDINHNVFVSRLVYVTVAGVELFADDIPEY